MMSDFHATPKDDMLDLLVDAIASGHEPEDVQLDGSIRSRFSVADVNEFEQAAAAFACVCAAGVTEQLPENVRLRCSGAARVISGGAAAANPMPAASRPAPLRFVQHDASVRQPRVKGSGLGWLAAAACLVIAAASWWPRAAVMPTETLSPEQRMSALIESAGDLSRWDWNAWDETYEGITGEVVWSESAQEGYLVLAGMPVNDPSAEQYQLWVIESSRGTPLQVPPVDGGVFDVADTGQVIVPIHCAIPAQGVVAFAVTIEQPGGVVVSDQSRKTVIAQAPAQG